MANTSYRAIVSSDWSECLSPNGPFDPITFSYPKLASGLSKIFKDYTGNIIPLTAAVRSINEMIPEPLTEEQMDSYLDASFRTYTGVLELIRWFEKNEILFMVNTTGTQGYFQRAIAKGLLPAMPFVSANPMIRFPDEMAGDRFRFEIHEIDDKPKNTEALMQSLNLAPSNVIVMGDSGGDGPHFSWGAKSGAFLVASMAKPSLKKFCASEGISIDTFFGVSYEPREQRDEKREMEIDFMELTTIIANRKV